jgi:hypothetical protein
MPAVAGATASGRTCATNPGQRCGKLKAMMMPAAGRVAATGTGDAANFMRRCCHRKEAPVLSTAGDAAASCNPWPEVLGWQAVVLPGCSVIL